MTEPSEPPIKIHPQYLDPFQDPEEAAPLGVFIIVWARMEVEVVMCVARILDTNFTACELLMEGMTSGPRINFFKRMATEFIKDDAMKKEIVRFCKDLSPLIEKRNQLIHGHWGTVFDHRHQTLVPGVRHTRHLEESMVIGDVPKLIEDTIKCASELYKISAKLLGREAPDPSKPASLGFGNGPRPR